MPYLENETVIQLLRHSYGQAASVALPTARLATAIPIGRFPAGVNDTLEHLLEAFLAWRTTNEVHWCFLVGGPGNGKSEALRSLAGSLQVALPTRNTGDPAPRTVPVDWPASALPFHDGLQIAFINDASIPRSDIKPGVGETSLYMDVFAGLARVDTDGPVVLFGNVNRGVLVEELSACDKGSNPQASLLESATADVLRWLASPENAAGQSGVFHVNVPATASTKYYSQARITALKRQVVIHALFLDALSLLEPAPGGSKSINFASTPPTVAPYRPHGGLDHGKGSKLTTVAGHHTRSWVEVGRWDSGGCASNGQACDARAICPFAENAAWLRTTALTETFLATLRGLEVVAGRRLSYRDFLAHLAIAIIGAPETPWLTNIHPCRWVADRHTSGDGPAIADLARHRVYMNLFPKPAADSWQKRSKRARATPTVYGGVKSRFVDVSDPQVSPFQHSLARIDPASDPEPWSGIRSRVLDMCEAADVELPAVQLKTQSLIPVEAQSDIETRLDQLMASEIEAELSSGGNDAAARVRLLRRWRGLLLLRQVGLATGNFTFRNVIEPWLKEHAMALRGTQAGSQLQAGISNLILPQVNLGTGQPHILVMPLRPRTYELRAIPSPQTPFVAIPHGDLRVAMKADGDKLIAELRMMTATQLVKIADVVVDFVIAREALIQAAGDATGFTEIDHGAFARIERARAALVSRTSAAKLALHVITHTGDRIHVEPNPSDTAPALYAITD